MKPDIQFIPSSQIDFTKWDQCIYSSNNGLIYNQSAYLNEMCDNWHGVIIDDYKVVMPIPWRKKMGLRYGYVPAFVQQLGITGNLENLDFTELMKPIQAFLSLADIHFNFSNSIVKEHFTAVSKTNLTIDLTKNYKNIYSAYRNDLKENIRKGSIKNPAYVEGSIEEAISLYREYYGERMPHIKREDYLKFQALCHKFQIMDQCFVKTIRNKEGVIMAIGLFLKDKNRIYNLMNTTLPAGRDKEANHYLLDKVIKDFAGQNLVFDFEGSALPGVNQFYQSFGSINQPYFHYHFNRLPWPLRLFKH